MKPEQWGEADLEKYLAWGFAVEDAGVEEVMNRRKASMNKYRDAIKHQIASNSHMNGQSYRYLFDALDEAYRKSFAFDESKAELTAARDKILEMATREAAAYGGVTEATGLILTTYNNAVSCMEEHYESGWTE